MRLSILLALTFLSAVPAESAEQPAPRNPPIRVQSADFKQGLLGRGGLRAALIGDSLSVPFHITGAFGLPKAVHQGREGGWFLDQKRDVAVGSLFQRWEAAKIPVAAMNLGIAGSWIHEPPLKFPPLSRVMGTDSMDRQVSRILEEPEFPNLILVWEGHNDSDWRYRAKDKGLEENRWDELCHALPTEISASLRRELQRLADRALKVDYPVTIMVFGLLDARAALDTRLLVQEHKRRHPETYPYLKNAVDAFPSIQEQYRARTIETQDDILGLWRPMVDEIDRLLDEKSQGRVRILYSNALKEMPLPIEALDRNDGLHLSIPHGHHAAAEAVAAELEKRRVLSRLGVSP